MQERGRVWKTVREKYPLIPYDTVTKTIRVVDIINFPGISKAQAFKRVKEWGALNFTNLESVIDYEDFETGKIIMEGWCKIWYSNSASGLWGKVSRTPDERKLFFSIVVTIKDGKAKVEYENLVYQYFTPSYIGALNVYVPSQTYRFPIDLAFPLVNSEPETWPGAVDLMKETMRELKRLPASMAKHIKMLDEDYRF